MVNLSRRLFLGGALAIAGATVAPAAAEALAPPPRIVGDGVHDDAPGLRALFMGEPVEIENQCVQVHSKHLIILTGGTFHLGSTIEMSNLHDIHIEGGTYVVGPNAKAGFLFSGPCSNISINVDRADFRSSASHHAFVMFDTL